MFKKILLAMFCALTVLGGQTVTAQTSVRGYTRSNGTYVAPHYRSSPDGKFANNWSTKGNVNPYTGKAGTRVMQREGRLKGHRVPVWYLPQEVPWWWWGARGARVINVWPSGDRFGAWRIAIAINGPLALGSIFLIRRGLKQIRANEETSDRLPD